MTVAGPRDDGQRAVHPIAGLVMLSDGSAGPSSPSARPRITDLNLPKVPIALGGNRSHQGLLATVNKKQGDNLQPSKAKSKRRRRNKGMCLEDRPVLEPNAAGIDVGAREMFVA